MKQQILAMEVELTNVVKTQQENDVQIADTKVGFTRIQKENSIVFFLSTSCFLFTSVKHGYRNER